MRNLLHSHSCLKLAGIYPWLVIALAAALALTHLGRAAFWDDEAQTGILARNFLHTGQLTGWDGRNLFAYRNGTLLDAQLRVIQPPLDILVTAAAFALGDKSPWAGRLPFVAAGILALVLFWRVVAGRFGADSARARFALALLALSTPFLLNLRQCRYYALALLFSVCVYRAYTCCLAQRRPHNFLLLTVAALLLFLSNFLIAVAFLGAIALLFLLLDRAGTDRRTWIGFAVSALLFAALATPCALSLHVLHRQDIAYALPWLVRKLILVFWNFRELNLLNLLPWPVMLVLAMPRIRRAAGQEFCRESNRWLLLLGANALFLALLSPQAPEQTRIADLRFLMAALPPAAILCGLCAARLQEWKRECGVAFAALLLGTNWLCLTPGNAVPRLLLPAYLAELARPVPTATGETVEFLREHARQDDVICAVPAYFNYPLLFHLGDRIVIGGQLNHATPLPPAAQARLPAPLYYETAFPDWIVAFGMSAEVNELLAHYSRPHRDPLTGTERRFDYAYACTLNVFASQPQRPELPWHRFAPEPVADPAQQGVTIFRRIYPDGIGPDGRARER